MKFSELKINDATTYETFGEPSLKSGAYLIDIINAQKWERDNKCFLSLEIKINEQTRYVQMWMTRQKDNKTIMDTFNSKRVAQMMYLLKIRPETVQEITTDRDNWFDIPQFKGSVGAVIEVKPAYACKPNKDGDQYPELSIISFYDFNTFKTLKEIQNKKEATNVEKMVLKLEEKEYKKYGNNTAYVATNNSAPSSFDVQDNISSEDLPF